MKIFFLSFVAAELALAIAPANAFAQCATGAAAVAETPVDAIAAESAAIEALRRWPPADFAEKTSAERARLTRERGDELARRALAFFEAHPERPERWAALGATYQFGRRFVTSTGEPDAAALAAWHEAMARRVETLLAAPDVSADVWQSVLYSRLTRAAMDEKDATMASLERARVDLVHLEKKFPESRYLPTAYRIILSRLEAKSPALYRVELARVTSHPRTEIAELTTGLLAVENLRTQPLDLKFTALDGRVVDFAELRGKVVLIDFWATWCKPCIAELPHVKKVYADYHAKGFEIVGVALDHARDERKLRELVARENLPWPQHFDGKGWKNELAERYSIGAIPAMFLLDQNGLLVATDARGEKLEAEVRRLLKL